MDSKLRRNWESVCGDCERYRQARCAMTPPPAEAKDSFAAICEWFIPDRWPQGEPPQLLLEEHGEER